MIVSLILSLHLQKAAFDYEPRFNRAMALVAHLESPVKVFSGNKLIRTLKPGNDEGFPLLGEERLEPTKGKKVVIIEGRQGVPEPLIRAYSIPALTDKAPFKINHFGPGARSMGTGPIKLPFSGDIVDPNTLEVIWKSKVAGSGVLDVYDEAKKVPKVRLKVVAIRDGKLSSIGLAELHRALNAWSGSVPQVRFELVSGNGDLLDTASAKLGTAKTRDEVKNVVAMWHGKMYRPYPELAALGLALEFQDRGMRTAALQALGQPSREPAANRWLRAYLLKPK